ncbi:MULTISPECIES: sporulation histidine kinase inhibitor Sda [Bacillaceae]
MKSLQLLQDQILLQAYQESIQLNLSNEFIGILLDEISRRNLFISQESCN